VFGLVTELKFDDQVAAFDLLELGPHRQANSGPHVRTSNVYGVNCIGGGDTEHTFSGHCTSIVKRNFY
jgi:hypothetical protein